MMMMLTTRQDNEGWTTTTMAQGRLQHYSTFTAHFQQLLKNKMVRFLLPDFLIP